MSLPSQAAGSPAIELATAGGDRATVLLDGAHVVGWAAGGIERLYLSPTSGFGGGAAIRGGVPVVFPQFNQRGPDSGLPKHGFARNRRWRLDTRTGDAATLALTDDDQTRGLWPHPFALKLAVALAPGSLSMTLIAENTGDAPFAFTAALHTYLAVDDVATATVAGLAGCQYLDTVVDRAAIAPDRPLAFAGETDRIYWDAAAPLAVASGAGTLEVGMDGFEDVVVWNPWADKAAALPDLPDDDWRRMLCVEAARIGRPVTLAPGELWQGTQRLALRA